MLPWFFTLLLVLLLFASPYPLVMWNWDNMPGGSGWYIGLLAATVVFFTVRRP